MFRLDVGQPSIESASAGPPWTLISPSTPHPVHPPNMSRPSHISFAFRPRTTTRFLFSTTPSIYKTSPSREGMDDSLAYSLVSRFSSRSLLLKSVIDVPLRVSSTTSTTTVPHGANPPIPSGTALATRLHASVVPTPTSIPRKWIHA